MELLGFVFALSLIFGVPVFTEWVSEPSPGFTTSVAESRKWDCEASLAEGAGGELRSPRGSYIEVSEVRCRPRILTPAPHSARTARESLLLDHLSESAQRLRSAALARFGSGGLWSVELIGFAAPLADKIRGALEAELASGLKVRDAGLSARADLSAPIAPAVPARGLFDAEAFVAPYAPVTTLPLGDQVARLQRDLASRCSRVGLDGVRQGLPGDGETDALTLHRLVVVRVSRFDARLRAFVCTRGELQWLI